MSAVRKARSTEHRSTVRNVDVGCPSGKLGYPTKPEAKRVARLLRKQGDNRLMNAYRCRDCGLVHLGHLPLAVQRGELSRSEYYGQEVGA